MNRREFLKYSISSVVYACVPTVLKSAPATYSTFYSASPGSSVPVIDLSGDFSIILREFSGGIRILADKDVIRSLHEIRVV